MSKKIEIHCANGKVSEMHCSLEEFESRYINKDGTFAMRIIRIRDTETGTKNLIFSDKIIQILEL